MNVYRITVTAWPTDDGKPWPRFIAGPGIGSFAGLPRWEDLPWFRALADPDTSEVQDQIDHEFTAGHDQAGEITGWILPRPRRFYFERAAAKEWCRKARILGAETVLESAPVTDYWGTVE